MLDLSFPGKGGGIPRGLRGHVRKNVHGRERLCLHFEVARGRSRRRCCSSHPAAERGAAESKAAEESSNGRLKEKCRNIEGLRGELI